MGLEDVLKSIASTLRLDVSYPMLVNPGDKITAKIVPSLLGLSVPDIAGEVAAMDLVAKDVVYGTLDSVTSNTKLPVLDVSAISPNTPLGGVVSGVLGTVRRVS